MSVETMVRSIDRDAAEEAAGLVARAEEQAHELVAAAESAVTARVDAACARTLPAIRGQSVRRVNEARIALLERRAAVAAERIAAAFDEAERRLGAIAEGAEHGPDADHAGAAVDAAGPADAADPGRWARSLALLAEEAVGFAGPNATLRVRPRDAAAVAQVAAAKVAVVTPDDAMPPGLILASADGRLEVDATLPARLRRARIDCVGAVAAALEPGS